LVKTKSEPMSIRLPEGLIADMKVAAERHGLSQTAFITKALEAWTYFDVDVLNMLGEWARGLNTSLYVVMETFLIDRLAREAADIDINGPSPKELPEFIPTTQGFLKGKQLFNTLKVKYAGQLEKEKVKELLEREPFGLEDDEKAFLLKHRAGRTWLESYEYKKELEREEAIKKYLDNMTSEEKVKLEAFQKKYGKGRTPFSASFWEGDEPKE